MRSVPETRDPHAPTTFDVHRGGARVAGARPASTYALIEWGGAGAPWAGRGRHHRRGRLPGPGARARSPDDAARALPRPHLQRDQRDDLPRLRGPRRHARSSSSSSSRPWPATTPSRPASRRCRSRLHAAPRRTGGALGRADRAPDPDDRRAARDGGRDGARCSGWTRTSTTGSTCSPGLTVFGLGLALMVAPLTATVLAAAPDDNAGIASGINNADRPRRVPAWPSRPSRSPLGLSR